MGKHRAWWRRLVVWVLGNGWRYYVIPASPQINIRVNRFGRVQRYDAAADFVSQILSGMGKLREVKEVTAAGWLDPVERNPTGDFVRAAGRR